MATTYFDFVRHGEPLGGNKIRGQSNDPLSERGWQQMRAATGTACRWDRVVTSPLLRCYDFARDLASTFGLPLQTDERLKEIGFGSWEGQSHRELTATDPFLLQRFWQDPDQFAPPGAEPVREFAARISAAWEDLVAQSKDQRVLVVCHAGVIRMTIRHVLALAPANVFRIKVPYAGVTRFMVEPGPDGTTMSYLISHAGGLD